MYSIGMALPILTEGRHEQYRDGTTITHMGQACTVYGWHYHHSHEVGMHSIEIALSILTEGRHVQYRMTLPPLWGRHVRYRDDTTSTHSGQACTEQGWHHQYSHGVGMHSIEMAPPSLSGEGVGMDSIEMTLPALTWGRHVQCVEMAH